jgi:hypothetical protein
VEISKWTLASNVMYRVRLGSTVQLLRGVSVRHAVNLDRTVETECFKRSKVKSVTMVTTQTVTFVLQRVKLNRLVLEVEDLQVVEVAVEEGHQQNLVIPK